jgi:hypothetical protein
VTGRFSNTPIAPFSSWCTIKQTARLKTESGTTVDAIINFPTNDSVISAFATS